MATHAIVHRSKSLATPKKITSGALRRRNLEKFLEASRKTVNSPELKEISKAIPATFKF